MYYQALMVEGDRRNPFQVQVKAGLRVSFEQPSNFNKPADSRFPEMSQCIISTMVRGTCDLMSLCLMYDIGNGYMYYIHVHHSPCINFFTV